jgi:hypothetical protein
MSPREVGSKIDCDDEDQQQFNRPTENMTELGVRRLSFVLLRMWLGTEVQM